MKKCLVIFDGSNFYHNAKRLTPRVHLTDFNYLKLTQIITGIKKPKIEYCVGEIKQDHYHNKSAKLYANQQALFYYLEKQGIEIKKGFMLRHLVYHEKGVDVRIALDILKGAIKNEYDECFIISSDTDILPAIRDALKEGKKIIYVGFDKNLSNAMKANCSKTFIITKKMIKDCAK